jgi:uncharacterized protein (DUF305 family)
MKKTSKFIALLLMATIALTSCKDNKKSSEKDEDKKESKADDKNDNQESALEEAKNDAVKLAKITCEYKMIAKDSANMGQNLEKVKEFEKIASDIQDKYTDKLKSMTGKDKEAMQKVLKRSYEDELAKCKE